jgi:hypothetical protein
MVSIFNQISWTWFIWWQLEFLWDTTKLNCFLIPWKINQVLNIYRMSKHGLIASIGSLFCPFQLSASLYVFELKISMFQVAFFLNPNEDFMVECLASCCNESSPARYKPPIFLSSTVSHFTSNTSTHCFYLALLCWFFVFLNVFHHLWVELS